MRAEGMECSKVAKTEHAEIDRAFIQLGKEIDRISCIATSFRNILSHEVEERNDPNPADHNQTIADMLHYLSGKLADQNNRMERLIEGLETKVGDVKII